MRLALIVLWSVAAGIPTSASGKGSCRGGEGSITRELVGFQIRISPHQNSNNPEPECQAAVLDSSKKVVFSEYDWGFSIELAGDDVNGDGIPDVVLEGYSGGAHCCWTYYIISLGAKPGLLKKFENQRDAAFFYDKKSGRIEIATRDGAFDYFDGLCHACTPFPDVSLRLDGTNLIDVSPEYVADYDEIISKNQKALTAEERQRLRAWTEKPSDAEPVREAVYKALMIVLAYLYSGRDAQARQTLHDLWPPFDQERIWNLILQTRHGGILCYTRKDTACGPDATTK